MKIESKIGSIPKSDETIYIFLTDFNNFKNILPADKIKNWEATTDQCSFEIEGLGKTGMKIIEKEPSKLIKLTAIEESTLKFFLWIQLKSVSENDTRIKITIEPNLNPMMVTMVKGPLKKFVDSLVEQMENFSF